MKKKKEAHNEDGDDSNARAMNDGVADQCASDRVAAQNANGNADEKSPSAAEHAALLAEYYLNTIRHDHTGAVGEPLADALRQEQTRVPPRMESDDTEAESR